MNALIKVHPAVVEKQSKFHADVVAEVQSAVVKHPVVVVGMAQNPHVKQARRFFEAKGVKFEYLEYGSYLSKWKERLAIKMWSGWPTFPQVYVHGVLLGGHSDILALDKTGELDRLIAGQ